VKKGRSWNTSTSISSGFLSEPESFTIDPNVANEETIIITAVPFNGNLVDFSFTYSLTGEEYSEFEKTYMKYL
jgi:hypothetical protein